MFETLLMKISKHLRQHGKIQKLNWEEVTNVRDRVKHYILNLFQPLSVPPLLRNEGRTQQRE